MEYANEEKKNEENKILKFVSKHKWITITIVALIFFSIINILMIYNFFELLQNL